MNCIIKELDTLEENWGNIEYIIPYGCGLEAYRTLNRIIKDFNVPYIIDNDPKKWGKTFYGIQIKSPEILKEKKNNEKVLVTIARRRYGEIKKFLEKYNLKENIDFCHISQFGIEWYYKNKREYNVFTMDIAVTTACTLRCKNCNMFTTYYKTPITYTFEQLKKNVDLLFKRIDYIFAIGILGGEAFLNKDLVKFLDYLYKEYREKFGSVCITTNGVVFPSKDQIDVIKKYNIIVIISDYKKAIKDKSKIDELEKYLKEENIICQTRRDLVWCDFGFPLKPVDIKEDDVRKHMMMCNPGWRGLNDGKFYFCNCAWSAERAGLFTLKKDDFLDLANMEICEETKKQIMLYSLGIMKSRYMSFCKVCGGCGEDNIKFVDAGEQI